MSHREAGISLIVTLAAVLGAGAAAHAATVYVANHGVDGAGCACGTKEGPCRSITCGIAVAAADDTIIVGPGRYAQSNGETGSPGCGCMVSINKSVDLVSSDGAAATIIDASDVDVSTNVLVITTNATFGKPGKGFMVTGTMRSGGRGMAIDAANIAIRGNQFIGDRNSYTDVGIETLQTAASILIEGNQVHGWFSYGIFAGGGGTTVRKNKLSFNAFVAIGANGGAAVLGNILTANFHGMSLGDPANAIGNAIIGNGAEGVTASSGVLQRTNVFENGEKNVAATECGLLSIASSASDLDATDNYWGASTGPGPDPADDAATATCGPADVTPFATAPFKVKAPIKP
jgi:hypothetical protein